MESFDLPDYTEDTATEYKTKIDQCITNLVNTAGDYAAQQMDPPGMGVVILKGMIPQNYGPSYAISVVGDLVVPEATITGIGAPAAGENQLHVISFNLETFTYQRHFSAPMPDTTDILDMPWPTVPNGNLVVAALRIRGASTSILNSDIIDVRSTYKTDLIFSDGAGGNVIVADKNGQSRVEMNAFGDRVRFKILTGAGTVEVMNAAAEVVAYFDATGNLFIKGTVQTIP